jgi:hypothetical protein
MNNDDAILEFLSQMEDSSSKLDEAVSDYGYLLEDTEVGQAYRDYMESRVAIKKVLKRVARDNNLNYVIDLID